MCGNNIQLRELTIKGIQRTIALFQKNSYAFLYESDIQATLFARLRMLLPETITIEGTGKPLFSYQIPIVNSEYGKKIDVVCLNVEQAQFQKIRIHKNCDMSMFDLPIHIGIEIKYRKQGDRSSLNECITDLRKLEKCEVDVPIVLGFVQNAEELEDFLSCTDMHKKVLGINEIIPVTTTGIIVVSPENVWLINT